MVETVTGEIVPIEEARLLRPLSVDEVVAQRDRVLEVMGKVMKLDIHYGKIPGCPKPTLFKPGAEVIFCTFGVYPVSVVIDKTEQLDFLSYVVRVDLFTYSGVKIGSGVGSANSREVKYRWRNDVVYEPTGREVPKDFWDKGRDISLIGGKGFTYKKNEDDGKWYIWKRTGSDTKVENPDPWDLQNTLIKMAEKRAKVDAALNFSACSEMFTQDIEDMAEPPKADNPPATPPPPKGKPASASLYTGETKPNTYKTKCHLCAQDMSDTEGIMAKLVTPEPYFDKKSKTNKTKNWHYFHTECYEQATSAPPPATATGNGDDNSPISGDDIEELNRLFDGAGIPIAARAKWLKDHFGGSIEVVSQLSAGQAEKAIDLLQKAQPRK